MKAKGQVKHKASTLSNNKVTPTCQLSYKEKELMSDLDRQVSEICYTESAQDLGLVYFWSSQGFLDSRS